MIWRRRNIGVIGAPDSGKTTLVERIEVDVKRMRLRPGDIVVARVDHDITAETAAYIKSAIEAIVGPDQRVLVVSGITIEIVDPIE